MVLLAADSGPDAGVDGFGSAHIHIVHQTHDQATRLVVEQRQTARLRQRQLHNVHLAVDGQDMRLGRIVHQTHATHMHRIVDVVDIVGDVLCSTHHLTDTAFQLVEGVDKLRHVASGAEDT